MCSLDQRHKERDHDDEVEADEGKTAPAEPPSEAMEDRIHAPTAKTPTDSNSRRSGVAHIAFTHADWCAVASARSSSSESGRGGSEWSGYGGEDARSRLRRLRRLPRVSPPATPLDYPTLDRPLQLRPGGRHSARPPRLPLLVLAGWPGAVSTRRSSPPVGTFSSVSDVTDTTNRNSKPRSGSASTSDPTPPVTCGWSKAVVRCASRRCRSC
jgi:hypothetical protein